MTISSVAFLGGSIGGPELVVVGIAVLILFGPKRLPEIAKTIGRFTAMLRNAAQDFRDQMEKAAEEAPAPAPPPSSSLPPGEKVDNTDTRHVNGGRPSDPSPKSDRTVTPERGDGSHDRA